MSEGLSYNELMTECRRTDSKEFKRILKNNNFAVRDFYPSREADKIVSTLGGRIDWFKYRSKARVESGETLLTYGSSQAVCSRLPDWYKALVSSHNNHDSTRDQIIGIVCFGGFLAGNSGPEFLLPFEPALNVLIGDRGAGKSTILNFIGILSGSQLEESKTLVNRLISDLDEQKKIEKSEFERRVRRALRDYGLDFLAAFYIRSGIPECYCVQKNEHEIAHALFVHAQGQWNEIPESHAQFGYPLQFLSQGEAVRIAEFTDVYYLNKLLDGTYPDLHEKRSRLAKVKAKLLYQFTNFKETPKIYKYSAYAEFRKLRLKEIGLWWSTIGNRGDVRYIIKEWQRLVEHYRTMVKPRSFRGIAELIQSEDSDDLFYFLIGPEIDRINAGIKRLQELDSLAEFESQETIDALEKGWQGPSTDWQFYASLTGLPPDSETYEASQDPEPDPDSLPEPLPPVAETDADQNEEEDGRQRFEESIEFQGRLWEQRRRVVLRITRNLQRGLKYLESFRSMLDDHRTDYTNELQALLDSYRQALQSKRILLEFQDEKCRQISRLIQDEETDARLYIPRYESIMQEVNGRLERLSHIRRRASLIPRFQLSANPEIDALKLKVLITRYEESVLDVLEWFKTRIALQQENPADFFYDPVQIELRQGNTFREFQHLSFGQKCGIILRLIARPEDTRVLILDQPEDHLDTFSIVHIVGPALKKLAAKRQIILATHNSSLLLKLDPNEIAVLEPMGEHGRLRVYGNLSRPPVVQQVLDTLEGGSGAFLTKLHQYENLLQRVIRIDKNTDAVGIERAFLQRSVDDIRNALQAVVADYASLDHAQIELTKASAARHELRNAYENSLVGHQVDAVLQTIETSDEIAGGYEEIKYKLCNLLRALRSDIEGFQQKIEQIKMFEATPTLEQIQLTPILEPLQKEIASATGRGRRRKEIQIDPRLTGLTVKADPKHLTWVFRNLLLNSFRATNQRAETLRGRQNGFVETVQIGLESDDDQQVVLRYQDNGLGMNQKTQENLYKMRCSDQPAKDHGLGGIIIGNFLAANKGKIDILDSTHEGTLQLITLQKK